MKRMLFITLVASALFTVPTMGKAQGGTWTPAEDRPRPGAEMASAVVDGKIYTMNTVRAAATSWGGREVWAYDPATDSWDMKALAPTGRTNARAAVVDGVIYVFGGANDPYFTAPLPTVQAYDPATDSWTVKADLPTPVQVPGVAAVNGKIYVIGGVDFCRFCVGQDGEEGKAYTNVYEYDPVSDTYTPKQSMPTPRGVGGTVVFEGKIYTFGGFEPTLGDVRLDVVEVYDPAIDAWTTRGPMPMTRGDMGVAVVHDKIYVIGGTRGQDQQLDRVDIYDPATDTWAVDQAASLSGPRAGLSVEVVDGRIYAVGGRDKSNSGYPVDSPSHKM